MLDELDSALLRELREGDPRQWLDWALAALSERIDNKHAHPQRAELRRAHRKMQEAVDSWPKDMYSPREVTDMVARVDALTLALENADAPLAAERDEDDKPNTTYSWTPPSRRTSPRPAKRKRTTDRPVDEPTPEKKNGARATASVPMAREERPSDRPHRDWSEEKPARALVVRAPPPPLEEPVVAETALVRPSDPAPTASEPPAEREGSLRISNEVVEWSRGSVDASLAMLTEPRGEIAEAYRSLFFRLGATSEARVIMVTTCSKEEDGASCAANLALAMAEGTQSTLLLEARFSTPRVAKLFDVSPGECFGRRLARHRRHPDEVWKVAHSPKTRLSVLAVDPSQQTPPALDAKALVDVVDGLAATFDYVVVDGPPAHVDSDARYVVRCVDGVVIAITAGVTRQRDVRSALALLGEVPVLGYVLVER